MPVFRIKTPDGRIARVQAPDADSAMGFARAGFKAPAPAKGGPSADYAAERAKADKLAEFTRKGDEENPWFLGGGAGHAITHAVGNTIPVLDELNAGVRAAGNEVWNRTYRAAKGQKPVNSHDIYDANIDASAADEKAREEAHPIAGLAGGLLGGLVLGAPAKGAAAARGGLSTVQKIASGVTAPIKGSGAVRGAMATAKAIPIGGAVGAGYGFLSGSGGLDQRLEAGKQAGEGGAITGGLLQGLASPVLGAVGDMVGPRLGQLADRFGMGFSKAGGAGPQTALAKVGEVAGDAPFLTPRGVLLRPAGSIDAGAPALGQSGKATVAGLKRALLPEEPHFGPVEATPSERRAAGQAAFRLASKKGLTSKNIADRAAPFAGKDAFASEVMGPEGERQLAAVARRGGETGDSVRTKVFLRNQAAPQRIADDFETNLGISPEFAAGDIESMVERGKAAAGPLWKVVDDNPAGIWSNELHGLSSLPDVRKALAAAEHSERIRQRGATGLTWGDVEVPHPGMDSPPPGAAPAAAGKAPRAPARAPSQGPSLTKWLADRGGTSDVGGDLASQGVGDWHNGRAFQARAIRPPELGGEDLDYAREAAHDAGFFPDHPEPPTMDEFKQALVQDATGQRKRFGRAPDAAAHERMAAREAHDEAVYRGHDGAPEPSEDDYGHAPGPQYEPARMEAPTATSWNKVRKAVSDMVERDPVTNRVLPSQRNRDLAALSTHLRDALAGTEERPGAVPGLREALAASGDPMAVQSAYERTRGRLTNGSVRDFGKLWASMKSEGERTAAKSALAQDVMELWGRGQLRGGKFNVPGIKGKIDLAFPGKSQAFIARMETEARLAASGARQAPWGGSATMGLGEAAGEQNAAGALGASDWKRAIKKLGSGHLIEGGADLIGTTIAHGLAHAKTPGMTEGMRNEYGRILQMSPEEFRGFLAHWERLPLATKQRFPLPTGLAAGGAAGQVTAGTF